MRSGRRETVLFVAYVLAGLLAAAVAGWLSYGPVALRNTEFLLHLLAIGFSGALIYISVRTRSNLLALIVILVLLAGNILLHNIWTGPALALVAVRSVVVGAAFFGAALVFRALGRVFMGKFLFMAALLGLAFVLNAVVTLLLQRFPVTPAAVWNPALAGLRLGALSGFLFELVDFIGLKLSREDAAAR